MLSSRRDKWVISLLELFSTVVSADTFFVTLFHRTDETARHKSAQVALHIPLPYHLNIYRFSGSQSSLINRMAFLGTLGIITYYYIRKIKGPIRM